MRGRRAYRWLLLGGAIGAVALFVAAAASGFDSGGQPSAVGPATITWTGQGATYDATTHTFNVDQQCSAADDPYGANQPYLYWVLNPGGNSTISPNPVLTLSGSGSGTTTGAPTSGNSSGASAVKFVTPYFTPDSSLIANVAMNVLTIDKKSSWNLVISHGCGTPGNNNNPPASDLNVFKTATPAADLTYKWSVAKSVDGSSSANIPSGGSATFNYNVTVTHDDGTLSDWTVSGDIVVGNPNVDTVNNVSVTDAIQSEPNANCSVDNGQPGNISPVNGSIPGGGSIDYSYLCTYSAAPAADSQTNEADVTYPSQSLPDDGPLTGNTLPGTASWNWSTDAIINPLNPTTSVYDSQLPGDGFIGNVDAGSDSNPTTFSYSLSFPGVAGTCTDYPNVATLDDANGNAIDSSSQTVSVCDGSDLNVSKTASPSFTRTYTWGIKKSVDNPTVNQPSGSTATSNYTVAVSHDNGTDSGWLVDGTITVSNPNDWEAISLTGVSDAIDNGGSCSITSGDPNGSVPAGGSVDLGYECSYSSAPDPASFTNTATATWDANAASTADGSASGSKDGAFGDPTTIVDGSVDVTDSTQGDLGTVSYTDDSPTLLTYSVDRSGEAGTCKEYDNTASFTTSDSQTTGSDSAAVTICDGSDLSVSKTASPSFIRTYTWGIKKSVDHSQVNQPSGSTATSNYTVAVSHDNGTDSAWVVDGTITVSNPNDWEAISLTGVSDAIDNGGSCSITSGDPNGSVPAGGSVDLGYECTYSSAPDPSSFTNTATATWDANAASTADGSASGSKDGAFGDPSSIVDGSVDVTDSTQGDLGTVSYTDDSPTTFTYSVDRSGEAGTCKEYDNTASFTTSDSQTTGSDSAAVTICDGSDLKVSKTATPSFTRTYNWTISKSVDKTLVEKSGGGTAPFTYTVVVTHDNGTDSGWKVDGTITVSNPNDWEAISLTGVSDSIDNGGSCSITSGDPNGSVPAGQSVTLGYDCAYSSAPNPSSFTNTATANWDANAASTPDGSASGTATGSMGSPTSIVHSSTTVTDTLNPSLNQTLTYLDASPWSTTYTLNLKVPTSNCSKYNNTASLSVGGSSSKTVETCGPAATGGLTIGYWQNKNGQAQIAGANQTTLAAYLKAYPPFADLSGTITTYVTNVIKAANASGSSMNAMLKAQMLATALNAYFVPGLGSTVIDLTNVNGENVSGAFGGATSMSISGMLTYAGGQSNTGGVTWYGNVKATQGLAKDAFDAINNQQVFAP